MKKRVQQSLITLFSITLSIPVSAETMLYWSNWIDKTITRANIDGTGMEIICPNFQGRGCDIDPNTNSLYWSDTISESGSSHGLIKRSRLNGTEEVTLITAESTFVQAIKLDLVNNQLYWANPGSTNSIMKANLDGTDIQTVLSQANGYIHDIELDIDNDDIYWTDFFNESIWRADLDGTNITQIYSATSISNAKINHIELDTVNGYIYFTTSYNYTGGIETGELYRINVDGTNLVEITSGVLLGIPSSLFKGVIINPEDNRLYFGVSQYNSGTRPAWIYSCNPDGSDLQEVISDLTGEPWAVVLGPGPECVNRPVSDLDNDCQVTLSDLSILISEWLDCGIEPFYECD